MYSAGSNDNACPRHQNRSHYPTPPCGSFSLPGPPCRRNFAASASPTCHSRPCWCPMSDLQPLTGKPKVRILAANDHAYDTARTASAGGGGIVRTNDCPIRHAAADFNNATRPRIGRGPSRLWHVLLGRHARMVGDPAVLQRARRARCHAGASLAAQTLPFKLVLVDNGSTDGSAEVAARSVARLGLDAIFIVVTEPVPAQGQRSGDGGSAFVWEQGIYVATCDADTWYPPDYLERATDLLDGSHGTVHAAVAYFLNGRGKAFANLSRAVHMLAVSRLLPFQCHSGGAGQVFLTSSLRNVGGFDPFRCKYVLEVHEIIGRISALGRVLAAYGVLLPAVATRARSPRRYGGRCGNGSAII